MQGSKVEKTSLMEMSKLAGKSPNSLRKRTKRAFEKYGHINIPGVGNYAVIKPGRDYQFIKISKDDKGLNRKLLALLEDMKEYLCEECIQVVEKIKGNLNGN